MRTILTALVLLFVINSISAQPETDWKRLNNYFKLLEDNDRFMGAVAVFKGDKRVFEYYSGLSSVSEQKHANYQTRYRIGSVTKLFTSVMIFQLIEEGRLSLDTELAEYYPQITNSHKITVAHLLNHRSGLHDYASENDFLELKNKALHKGEIMSMIVNYPIDFEPGEKAGFSNTNYLLLGFIIERLTNENYSMQLQSRLCSPFLLTGIRYGGTINTNMYEAQSYVYRNKQWEILSETDISLARGSGGVIATVRDLNVFAQALFKRRIISPESLGKMLSVQDDFGMGVFRFPYNDRVAFGHNGNIDGFQSHISYFPDDSVSISVLGNGMNYPLNEVITTTLDEYYGNDYKLPKLGNRQVDVPINILNNLEGNYVCNEYPGKLSLVIKDDRLYAQTGGHAAFPLTSYENGSFRFDPVGFEIKFEGDMHSIVMGAFVLHQRGAAFNFTKE